MTRAEYLAELRAQGRSNAHAAVSWVAEWGGRVDRAFLARKRLARGAARAVRLGLLHRVDGCYCLTSPLTA